MITKIGNGVESKKSPGDFHICSHFISFFFFFFIVFFSITI